MGERTFYETVLGFVYANIEKLFTCSSEIFGKFFVLLLRFFTEYLLVYYKEIFAENIGLTFRERVAP